MEYSDGLATLLAMGAVICAIVLVIGLVFYVLKSIGLYTLAQNRGIENPWLAWIPITDLYITGMLVGEMDLFGLHIDNLGLWFPVATVGGSLLCGIPVLGVLIWFVLMIFLVMFLYKLFDMYSTNAILFTILSLLLGLFPIFIFAIRNNEKQVSAAEPAFPADNSVAMTYPTAPAENDSVEEAEDK